MAPEAPNASLQLSQDEDSLAVQLVIGFIGHTGVAVPPAGAQQQLSLRLDGQVVHGVASICRHLASLTEAGRELLGRTLEEDAQVGGQGSTGLHI